MPKFTRQQTFDKAVNGLISQGKRAISSTDSRCKYRYRGLKCAVGHLIPDDQYSRSMEGKSINPDYLPNEQVPAQVTLLMKKLGHDTEFCAELQAQHDFADNFNAMCEGFIEFARLKELDLPRGLCL